MLSGQGSIDHLLTSEYKDMGECLQGPVDATILNLHCGLDVSLSAIKCIHGHSDK